MLFFKILTKIYMSITPSQAILKAKLEMYVHENGLLVFLSVFPHTATS